jgi:hypothetical protein
MSTVTHRCNTKQRSENPAPDMNASASILSCKSISQTFWIPASHPMTPSTSGDTLLPQLNVSFTWFETSCNSVRSSIQVRFQVLVAARVKMTVCWDVAPCGLVVVHGRFTSDCWLHHQGDDGGSMNLWSIGQFLPNYKAQHPSRQSPSSSVDVYIV